MHNNFYMKTGFTCPSVQVNNFTLTSFLYRRTNFLLCRLFPRQVDLFKKKIGKAARIQAGVQINLS